jgi:hypothetical protein
MASWLASDVIMWGVKTCLHKNNRTIDQSVLSWLHSISNSLTVLSINRNLLIRLLKYMIYKPITTCEWLQWRFLSSISNSLIVLSINHNLLIRLLKYMIYKPITTCEWLQWRFLSSISNSLIVLSINHNLSIRLLKYMITSPSPHANDFSEDFYPRQINRIRIHTTQQNTSIWCPGISANKRWLSD